MCAKYFLGLNASKLNLPLPGKLVANLVTVSYRESIIYPEISIGFPFAFEQRKATLAVVPEMIEPPSGKNLTCGALVSAGSFVLSTCADKERGSLLLPFKI